MALVSPDEVSTLLQRTFSDDEESAVELILQLMQGELELMCGRPLTPKPFTEIVAVRDSQVFLSKTPVQSVVQIRRVDGTILDPTTSSVRNWGVLLTTEASTGGWSPMPPMTSSAGGYEVEVTYTGGLPKTDWRYQGARSLLMGRVSRVVNKVHDDAVGTDQVSQEGYTAAYMKEGWTDQEVARAGRLKRRVVVA